MMKAKFVSIPLLLAVLFLSGCSAVEDAVSHTVNQEVDKAVDQAVDAAVDKAVESIGLTTPASSSSQAELEWAFTKAGQHPEKLLIGVINEAQSTLDIGIYSLTHPDIVKAILNAKKRGVEVRIITDEQQAGGEAQKQALKMIHNAGIPIKIDNHSGLMHLKMTIADKKVATNGSFNYTKAASATNDEVIMVIRNVEVAQSFTQEFERMWKDTKDFVDYR